MSDQIDLFERATALLDEVRQFAAGLDEAQRGLLAALLAPGIAAAWAEDAGRPGTVTWHPDRLPRHLVAAVQAQSPFRLTDLDTGTGTHGTDPDSGPDTGQR